MSARTLPRVRSDRSSLSPRRCVAGITQLVFDSIAQVRTPRGAGDDDAKHWNVRFTHSLLLQPGARQATGYGSTAVWFDRHPYIGALQTGVSIERQFSRIFPAHPRSLASVLIPRPAARRCSASFATANALLVWVSKQKPPAQQSARLTARGAGEVFLRSLRRKHIGLGSGAHSRRFAQECPEGIPGKYNQGEKQWHSTKTT